MDPVSLVFYAGVCGLLGLAGPSLGTAPIRLAIGAVVGVVAVSILPFVHQMLGVGAEYTFAGP
ncbi:hypothetical protein [Antarctobacter heliothermus]|uniref:Uncharacterized protein n=1 Tax=Antarctobacter heliothermus TaxID=74033 RepID=A0A239GJI9_9RHOB|nr:hypothetical protein [Antarctobacter heliothermus]SNS69329.1 hypothetical protein SAMN04488078_102718 [Antarctobacter heliothermus]